MVQLGGIVQRCGKEYTGEPPCCVKQGNGSGFFFQEVSGAVVSREGHLERPFFVRFHQLSPDSCLSVRTRRARLVSPSQGIRPTRGRGAEAPAPGLQTSPPQGRSSPL